jgi:hypothetical protein
MKKNGLAGVPEEQDVGVGLSVAVIKTITKSEAFLRRVHILFWYIPGRPTTSVMLRCI